MPSPSPYKRLALLGGLYLVQGLPFGFQANALPVYLRSHGVSLGTLSVLGLLAAPWMFKALWAPLVDRYHWPALGRRRSWIVPAQLGIAACCFAGALLTPEAHLPGLLGLVFLMNLFAATQDIAVDGLAVDLLGPTELGPGNAVQVIGYKVGMLAGGGLLVAATAQVGWAGLFVSMGLLVLAVCGWVLAAGEPESEAGERAPVAIAEVLRRLVAAARAPGGALLLLFVATYKLGESMVDTMFKPFLVDSGFEPAQIGLWVGTWGLVASVVGSAFGGLLAARLPLLTAVAIGAITRSLAMGGELWLALVGPQAHTVIAVTCAENLFGGVLTTALFALMMSKVDKRIGATHFTVLATVEVLGKMLGSTSSGVLTQATSYAFTFAVGLALSIAYLGLLPLMRRAAQ